MPTKKKPAQPACKNCQKPFDPRREWQEFCTTGCRKEFWKHGGFSIERIRPALRLMIQEELKRAMPAALKELMRIQQQPAVK